MTVKQMAWFVVLLVKRQVATGQTVDRYRYHFVTGPQKYEIKWWDTAGSDVFMWDQIPQKIREIVSVLLLVSNQNELVYWFGGK